MICKSSSIWVIINSWVSVQFMCKPLTMCHCEVLHYSDMGEMQAELLPVLGSYDYVWICIRMIDFQMEEHLLLISACFSCLQQETCTAACYDRRPLQKQALLFSSCQGSCEQIYYVIPCNSLKQEYLYSPLFAHSFFLTSSFYDCLFLLHHLSVSFILCYCCINIWMIGWSRAAYCCVCCMIYVRPSMIDCLIDLP